MSITSWYGIETAEWIQLVFGVEAIIMCMRELGYLQK